MTFRLFVLITLVFWPCLSTSAVIQPNETIAAPDYGALPAKGGGATEPINGAVVTRKTDVTDLTPDRPADALIVYSRYSPTNSSGKFLLVHGTDSTSCWVSRLSDNAIIGKLAKAGGGEIGEKNEIRWDYSGKYPTRVYFVDGMKFYRMDVLTENGSPILIHDFSSEFPAGVKIINDVEGDSSNDSRYWAWQVLGAYNGTDYPRLAFITYDQQETRIMGKYFPADALGDHYTNTLPKPNMVEISPSGEKVILHYGRATSKPFVLTGPWVYNGDGIYNMSGYKASSAGNSVFSYLRSGSQDLAKIAGGSPANLNGNWQYTVDSATDTIYVRLDGTAPTVLDGNWGIRPLDVDTVLDGAHALDLNFTNPVKVSISETHSGWCFDTDGNEVFVSQQNSTDKIQACWLDGTQSAYPNNCIDVLDHGVDLNYTNMHFGKFYKNNLRGWFQMSTYDSRVGHWSYNNIMLVELKRSTENPRIWRATHTMNDYAGDYRDEAPAALSFDGRSLYWTANWGNTVIGHGEILETIIPDEIYQTIGGILPPKGVRMVGP